MHAGCLANMLDDNSLGNSPNIDAKSVKEFCHQLRSYFALRPGTSWMQFQRKALTVVGLAAPFGQQLKKWWQLLIGRRVWL